MMTRATLRAPQAEVSSTSGIVLQRAVTSPLAVMAQAPISQPELLEPVLVEALKDTPQLLTSLRFLARFAGWTAVLYAVFHSEEAGSFSDEVNPITGQAYSSKEERDAVKALAQGELRSRIIDARRQHCDSLHERYKA